jgi:ligand-binding sensor domain-containing protein/signal transduction histidine kinase
MQPLMRSVVNLLNLLLRLPFRFSFRRFASLAIIALVVWSSVFSLEASDIPGASKRFLVRAWQSHDGLPSNVVRVLAQSADGYLWIGTAEGVIRFDGVRFSELPETAGGALARRPPRALFALPDGSVWIATSRGGLLRWDGRSLREVWADADPAVPSRDLSHVHAVMSDGQGGTWLVRRLEVFHVSGNAPPLLVERTPELEEKIRRTAEGQAQAGMLGGPPLELKDRRGRVWSASESGDLVVRDKDGSTETMVLAGAGARSRIHALLEDREGSLWVGTGESGLLQIRPRRVEVLGVPEGLRERTLFAVMEDRAGALWIGNKSGGLDRMIGGVVEHFELVTGGGIRRPVSTLCEDRTGTLWVATRDGSVFRRVDGTFRNMSGAEFEVSKVIAIIEDGSGRLWFGGQHGLAAWDGRELTKFGPERGFTMREVTTLAIDATGAIWAGGRDGTVVRGSMQGFERIIAPAALRGHAVSALLPERNGTMWITTLGAGLFRWSSGKLAAFAEAEGLAEPRLTCVLDDGAGYLWLGSLSGIFRVSKAELVEMANGRESPAKWLQLDRSDGLLTSECTGGFQPAGWRARDGVLWFPTINGLARIEPATLEVNTAPVPVLIEDARADGIRATPGSGTLQAGPGRARLDFRYTALSFAGAEKVRFRVMLEGLEGAAWRDVDGQRTAVFETVPPGRYHFRVRATNGDGIWNEGGGTVAVEVIPHIWQTTWFRTTAVVLAGVLAGAIGWIIARARMRGRLLRLELQTSREKERARIAQDLHDDLGASLTEISLLAQLHAEEGARPPLPEIAAKAHRLVGALDEIVWAVNPRHDTVRSLAEYLGAFAAEFLETAGMALRLEIPPDLPARQLDAEQRHGLFLGVREALHNAVKHSGATEVRLRFILEKQELTIAVEDNGRGISAPAGELSEGTRNMRARLQGIGGRCRMESNGTGTKVSFAFPLV